MASLSGNREKCGRSSRSFSAHGYWRKIPRKRKKGPRKGTWVKTKVLNEEDPYLQWAGGDIQRYALNVHARDVRERNLSTTEAKRYYGKLLRRAMDSGHEFFLVIHGSKAGDSWSWLRALKKLFNKACSMYKSCTAISKIKINEISPGLRNYLLQFAD